MLINVKDGVVKQNYTIKDLKADNPMVSFPKVISEEILNRYNTYTVDLGDIPEYDRNTQMLVREEPKLVDGIWKAHLVIKDLPEEQVSINKARFVKRCENAVDRFIHQVIIDYNKTNNTAFGNVHSCANYATVNGYTHQKFCSDVWLWSVSVWEIARKALDGTITINTTDDLIALLPPFKTE